VSFVASGQTIKGDGRGQTVAIVDAYDDPNIVSDLSIFDATFGLSNNDGAGLFALTKQKMSSSVKSDSGWGLEISLDVEWAHAMAPGAHILLVEAKSASISDLLGAVDYARNQTGVAAVSMSWGAGEFSGEALYDSYFTTPSNHGGVTFLASSGDSGAPAEWPAVSPNIVAVGGTTVKVDSSGNWLSETGWKYSGGGISRYESKPTYQSSVTQSSTKRTNPDVAWDADPASGVAVYDSFTYQRQSGWFQVGGTSASAPQWAALIAIADQGRALSGKGSLDGFKQTLPAIYSLPATDFHDILSGNNGYKAGVGYDLVTGRGSPYANLVVRDLVGVASLSGTQLAKNTSPFLVNVAAGTKDEMQEPSPVFGAAGLTAGKVEALAEAPTVGRFVAASIDDASTSVTVTPVDGSEPSVQTVQPTMTERLAALRHGDQPGFGTLLAGADLLTSLVNPYTLVV
jgi:subtilase family serine protease